MLNTDSINGGSEAIYRSGHVSGEGVPTINRRRKNYNNNKLMGGF
jgi:hypothetical protein